VIPPTDPSLLSSPPLARAILSPRRKTPIKWHRYLLTQNPLPF
jgi:hypothetical protein